MDVAPAARRPNMPVTQQLGVPPYAVVSSRRCARAASPAGPRFHTKAAPAGRSDTADAETITRNTTAPAHGCKPKPAGGTINVSRGRR
jgi:hypothetical protein